MTFDEICLKYRGRVLTGRYAHCCDAWDELPIDETTDEWPCPCEDTIKELDALGEWDWKEETRASAPEEKDDKPE